LFVGGRELTILEVGKAFYLNQSPKKQKGYLILATQCTL